MSGELWRWGASELASAIRARQISGCEAVASCLRRLEEVNPVINAVVDVLHDQALKAADDADGAVARGEELGALHGVPVTFKINVDFAGRASTNGVVAFKDRVASVDSPPVANWRKAGAIPIGRTNVLHSARASLRQTRCMVGRSIPGQPSERQADQAVELRRRLLPNWASGSWQ